jgi:hypothetical protein
MCAAAKGVVHSSVDPWPGRPARVLRKWPRMSVPITRPEKTAMHPPAEVRTLADLALAAKRERLRLTRSLKLLARSSHNENKAVRGSVMKPQYANDVSLGIQSLNAVALQNAVLCAECDVVSDSPHDRCLVCGRPSLFNIARMLGGTLPKNRTNLVKTKTVEPQTADLVLVFLKQHRLRTKASA